MQDLPAQPSPARRGAEHSTRWAVISILFVLSLALSFGLGFALREATTTNAQKAHAVTSGGSLVAADGTDFSVILEIYQTLKDHYVDPSRIDGATLRQAAIDGILNAVGDTHQVYVNKDQRIADSDLSGQFEGIGASVDSKDGKLVIIRPFNGSPAERAGIRPGDTILEVNGQSTRGWSVPKAVATIRGPKGSKVELKVQHADGTVQVLTVTRDTIPINSVFVEPIHDANGTPVTDLAYIRIEQFTDRTPTELRQALTQVLQSHPKGLILDLRNDPGGTVTSVVDVASEFQQPGVVLVEEDRGGSRQVLRSHAGGLATDIPLVVLVNHNSASGSEVLAGALRDNGRATVIGEQTFGKGTVNRFFELSNGGALYVSIGRWLTPKGHTIEGTGLTPDIVVSLPASEDLSTIENAQLYRAIDYLRSGH